MTPLEFSRILRDCGFKANSQPTGSSEWTRTFILHNGVTYGRASFHNGNLEYFKWYSNSGVVFKAFCVDMMMQYNFMPCIEQYNHAMYYAAKEAELHYRQKINGRAKLPFKKRKALSPPNPSRWFLRIFIYSYIIFPREARYGFTKSA